MLEAFLEALRKGKLIKDEFMLIPVTNQDLIFDGILSKFELLASHLPGYFLVLIKCIL